jgi:hypothetical protein
VSGIDEVSSRQKQASSKMHAHKVRPRTDLKEFACVAIVIPLRSLISWAVVEEISRRSTSLAARKPRATCEYREQLKHEADESFTRAARLVHKAGGSLRDVQLLAGHRSIQTTQRYIDGDSDAQRKLVSLI